MKFKMNDIEYEIKEVTQKEYKNYRKEEDELTNCEETDTSKGVYFGASHHYKDIVFIDKNLPYDRKKRVLMHELMHCYISEYINHQDNNYSEEDVADISANSHDIIHKIIKDYFK